MKKLKTLAALMLVLSAGVTALNSCDKENEEDSNEPFTMTANLPEDTAETDAVYIVGEFNGGEEFALGNPKWELKGTATKRSITLDPKDFVGGKTLDGLWCLQSPTRGVEVAADGVALIRTGRIKEVNVVGWAKAAGPGFDPSGTWRLVGTINDWDEKVGIDMTQEGTAWVAKGIHLKADDQFKFVMDHSWATNFGAGEPGTTFTAELNEEFDLQADGGNIKAANGYYDIYLYPFEAKAKLVDGGDEPGPGPDPKPVTAVAVAPTELNLKVGESETLKGTITPTDAVYSSLEWVSASPEIAAVDKNGHVTALAAGETTVTFTVDGISASCAVSVTEDVPPQPTEGSTVYAYDGNAWGSMNIWAWNASGNMAPEWPGKAAEATEVVNGNSFYKFTIPAEFTSETENLNIIFCNGTGTSQTADLSFAIKPGQTYYFNVLGNTAEIIDPSNFTPAEPPVKDGSWGIAGTMNGWKAENAIAMEVVGDYYVAKGVTLTADVEFKFVQDKSWDVNRGGTFVKLGESFDLTQDGANIKPGLSGTYDIYIKSDGSSAYIPAP